MSINHLFCTPEQGRRLQELLPSITSAFVWKPDGNLERSTIQRFLSDYPLDYCSPALTLQELRDILDKQPNTSSMELGGMMNKLTAPELAAWVIERLEEAQP